MKILLTGLIALSGLMLAKADQLTSPTPAGTPTTQPTIIINNNIIQQVVPAPVIAVPAAPSEITPVVIEPWTMLIDVYGHYQSHDAGWLINRTQDGLTNYFGRKHCSNYEISRDMESDSRKYVKWNIVYYKDTFRREVSNEYSVNWEGPMIYDSIEIRSNVYEYGARWHSAYIKFTVGFTYVNNDLKIYALIYQVM